MTVITAIILTLFMTILFHDFMLTVRVAVMAVARRIRHIMQNYMAISHAVIAGRPTPTRLLTNAISPVNQRRSSCQIHKSRGKSAFHEGISHTLIEGHATPS